MATEEARSLLDALMGGDRNAPLPKGAAKPGNKRAADGQLLLPGKRHRSCFDPDIDPLYTAWGVDVYDLFVNTKSDLGANPYVVDDGARQEYLDLPGEEKERLGFEYFLFQKLSELVRSCDRIVARNKEKLQQELLRKSASGDLRSTEEVDMAAVDALVADMAEAEELEKNLNENLDELDKLVEQESTNKKQLEPLLSKHKPAESEDQGAELSVEDKEKLSALQLELGKLTLDKQRVLYAIATILSRLAPLQDGIAGQRRTLDYVRSDLSTDKTVCEVSGNFMSARDADERIAAHYAGKQYQGWKLVRDKYDAMIKEYGRYGPPPPSRGGGTPMGGPTRGMGRGFRGRGGPPPPASRGSGRFDGGFRGGPPPGDRDSGRWERHGPPSGRGGGWRR